MSEDLVALFPLPLVLFPRVVLPLHIFEERYKEMIGEAMGGGMEFGVVLAREAGVVNTGCTASVDQLLHRYPDGRLDIMTRGRRRFELFELVEGRSFLRGRVRFFDDEEFDPTPLDLKQRALEGYTSTLRATGHDAAEPEWNDPQLSFQLAQIIADLDFRQQLLAIRSERDRMKQLAEFFPNYVTRWRHAEHLREVTPRNGHGKIHQN